MTQRRKDFLGDELLGETHSKKIGKHLVEKWVMVDQGKERDCEAPQSRLREGKGKRHFFFWMGLNFFSSVKCRISILYWWWGDSWSSPSLYIWGRLVEIKWFFCIWWFWFISLWNPNNWILKHHAGSTSSQGQTPAWQVWKTRPNYHFLWYRCHSFHHQPSDPPRIILAIMFRGQK